MNDKDTLTSKSIAKDILNKYNEVKKLLGKHFNLNYEVDINETYFDNKLTSKEVRDMDFDIADYLEKSKFVERIIRKGYEREILIVEFEYNEINLFN